MRECLFVGLGCSLLSIAALFYCAQNHLLLLYGDAVAHLHIARRVIDSLNPGFHQLGSVWLPLPHILLLPFVLKMSWWQSAVPAAFPSMLCYVAGCVGIYRLARLWLLPAPALVGLAFYALNPGLLYMQTTAMTEPLFLAEMIWGALLLAEHGRAVESGHRRRAARALIAAGLVMVAAVYTRYDGWIYATVAWVIVAVGLIGEKRREAQAAKPIDGSALKPQKPLAGAFVLFTVMLAVAPAIWMAYNARQFGDPLDFLRGPYSAKAIEARTATPGAPHYPGWHSMPVAALYFLKTAEGGAAPIEHGNYLLFLAVAGSLYAALRWRGTPMRAALLLWMPLPFYAWSIAYGSVPIFIPLWWPHSWYNTRYGMEMLPAFAFSLAMLAGFLRGVTGLYKPRYVGWIVPIVLPLIVLNAVTLADATPLVLREAYANSETRIPFERALAAALLNLPDHDRLLMYTSAHIGALQQAGIPLKGTINEGDYYQWATALKDPARAEPIIVAIDGDPVADAVAAHPQGLLLLSTVHSTGQPVARIYASTLFQAGPAPTR
jgi:hypothetical protein